MIFITGASSGIGAACAERFAAEGHGLILAARRVERLEKLAAHLTKTYNVDVHNVQMDVRDKEQVTTCVHAHKKHFKKITLLINNAGLAKGLALLQDGNPTDWDTMIDTNIKGLLYVTHAVLPYFLEKNDGHIINIGSIAGHWTYPKGNVYSATKHAVRALNESMRLDLHGTGVRVTSIDPGMVDTEFSLTRLGSEEAAKAVYAGMTALSAADIADTVHYAYSRPKHVNIQELIVYPTDQASVGLVNRKGEKPAQ